MVLEVRTPVYEGPFDLLLHLILREQVDLYEVSLAAIVDAYLQEIERLEELNLDLATEFLLIASTLVELKARRLLPEDSELDLDDELALWDERDLLLTRLLDCKTFKDAAQLLGGMADLASRSFARTAGLEDRFLSLSPDLLEGIDASDLHAAYTRAMTPRPVPVVDLGHVSAIKASVADALVELIDELPRAGRVSFRRLTEALVDRIEVVVRFLAVLELFKQGLVDLDQPRSFGEIEIVWVGRDHLGADELAEIDDYEG
jgi:segregation and condensation protein A